MYKIRTQRKESRFDTEKNILLLYYLMVGCVCVCVCVCMCVRAHTYTHVHPLLLLVSCGTDLNKTLALKWNIHERAAGIEGSCNTGQARILEWVAIPFSRGSSRPFGFPTLQADSLQSEPPGKPLSYARSSQKSVHIFLSLCLPNIFGECIFIVLISSYEMNYTICNSSYAYFLWDQIYLAK